MFSILCHIDLGPLARQSVASFVADRVPPPPQPHSLALGVPDFRHSSSSTSWATMGHTRACLRSRVFRSPASPLRPREDVRIIILTSVCPSRPPAWAGHRVPHRRPKAVPENHTSRRGPRGRPCGFMGFLRPFGAVRQARVLVRGTSRLATRVFLLGLWIRGVALVSFSR